MMKKKDISVDFGKIYLPDVFSKKETLGQVAYLMYFYYDREKYVVVGRVDENTLREIVIEYKNIILNDYYE